jgi:hypothetical protein
MLRLEARAAETEPAIMLAIGVKLTRDQVAEIKLAAGLWLACLSVLVILVLVTLGGVR